MKTEAALKAQTNGWMQWYEPDLDNTRERILFAAFKETHLNGFQAASIQNIINLAGVTKGALYHYFASKQAIACALIDEVYAEYIDRMFLDAIKNTDDPIGGLIYSLYSFKDEMSDADVSLGCPFDTFTQEMAPIDASLATKIEALRLNKHQVMVTAFKRGQQAGTVSLNIDSDSLAVMVNIMMHGCMGIAKSAGSVNALMENGRPMIEYLKSQRTVEGDSLVS